MSGIFNFINFHLLPLGLALSIGVAAGWWMFRQPPATRQDPEDQAKL